jgi:hypothetical protein
VAAVRAENPEIWRERCHCVLGIAKAIESQTSCFGASGITPQRQVCPAPGSAPCHADPVDADSFCSGAAACAAPAVQLPLFCAGLLTTQPASEALPLTSSSLGSMATKQPWRPMVGAKGGAKRVADTLKPKNRLLFTEPSASVQECFTEPTMTFYCS